MSTAEASLSKVPHHKRTSLEIARNTNVQKEIYFTFNGFPLKPGMINDLYPIDANEEDYLFIAPSQIPQAGLGLFTAITLYRGDIVASFNGEVLTAQEAQRRLQRNEADYFMNLPNGRTLDCMHTAGFAKMANDNRQANFKVNAIITMDNERVVLVASKTIHSNEEIFTSYGKHYWATKTKQPHSPSNADPLR